MKFLSPEEDFDLRTLSTISGSLRRTSYLLGLRDENGTPSHWGLERAYGAKKAREVIRTAYSKQLQEILRSSIRDLWVEATDLYGTGDDTVFLSRMSEMILKTAQEELAHPHFKHLSSTLDALAELAQTQAANLGSSQARPPVQ